ncbi:hypothetical protein, partial [Sessilibacter sp. MAH4]
FSWSGEVLTLPAGLSTTNCTYYLKPRTKKFLILESLFGFKPEAIPKGEINFLKTVKHRHRLKIKYQKEYNHWVCYDDAQAHN